MTEFLAFVAGPHGDHRVPIQKLIQALLLRVFGFDFRALTGFNAVLAAAISIVLLLLAKHHRGRSSIGDLMIPAIAVNFCTPFTSAGFDMQILTGTLFMALFTYAIVVRQSLNLALVMLLMCAWCGLNGAAMALVGCVGIAYWLRKTEAPLNSAPWVLLGIAVISCLAQVILWRLGATPHSYPFGMDTLFSFVTGAVTSNLFAWAAEGRMWKFALISVLLLAGFYALFRSMRREGVTIEMLGFALPMFASLLMIFVAATGRSNRPWTQDYDIHYGYMAILLPIYAWILLSKQIGRIAGGSISIALIAFYATSFVSNYQTRIATVSTSHYYYGVAQQAIASEKNARAVADEFIGMFSYAVWTNEQAREFTADGISRLRKFGGRQYKSSVSSK
jgi:hypothetical protein